MVQQVVINFQFPRIPDDFDEDLTRYLLELQRLIESHFTGDEYITGNLEVGGSIRAENLTSGVDGKDQGILILWDGSGGNQPAYIQIASPDGTVWYLFVEDDGTLKIHTAVPTQNSDGSAIGDQTD